MHISYISYRHVSFAYTILYLFYYYIIIIMYYFIMLHIQGCLLAWLLLLGLNRS